MNEHEVFEKQIHPKILSWVYFCEVGNVYKFKIVTRDTDKYRALSEINFGRKMWLASKNREGYKLVPVALIERCIGHIATAECHPNITHNEANQLSGDMSELNNLIEP